ncbi:MAG: methyltransferase domain-containing protein [Cohaesibacteraceae bacterium]
MAEAAPKLFDRALLRQRRRRAEKLAQRPGARDPGFLLDHVLNDVDERLAAVERSFDTAIDLSNDDGRVAARLAENPRVQSLVRLVEATPVMVDAGTPTLVGDLEALPLATHKANLITSLLALQWINDLPGTLVQIRRALRPDGLFLGTFVGGATLNELRDVLTQEEAEATGGASPKVMPFVDVRDFGSLLQRAGFALPVTDVDTLTVRYDTLFSLMADLRAMAATNILRQRSRRPWTRSRVVRAAQLYADKYSDPDGRIRATFQIISFSGWAPSEIQQKPLRPGSARTSLAEALGTDEKAAGEKAGL